MSGGLPDGSCRLSRHKYQLSWITRSVSTSVEARVELFDLEAAPNQKVLDFEAEQISHRKAVNQTLLTTARMRDVVDQFNVSHLIESVVSDGSVSPDNPPTIRR